MEFAASLPNYMLSANEEHLISEILEGASDGKPETISYAFTESRRQNALAIALAAMLASIPNVSINVLTPYKDASERLANLTQHWMTEMKRGDITGRTRTCLKQNNSSVRFLCPLDIDHFDGSILIITEDEYISLVKIRELFALTSKSTKVIVLVKAPADMPVESVEAALRETRKMQ